MNVGVLLAAGASRRMGRPKPLLRSGDESYLARGVRHLWTACDSVVVVLGAGAAAIRRAAEEEFERLVRRGALDAELHDPRRRSGSGLEVRFVVNRRWASGMFSSVRVGLREAAAMRPAAVVVMPVDQPAVRPTTVRDLAAAMAEALAEYGGGRTRQAFAYALVPRYHRRGGHPIVLSPGLARAILADPRATTLSEAVRRNARLVGYLESRDPGVVQNRNTPEA